jgi:hypothetical protein
MLAIVAGWVVLALPQAANAQPEITYPGQSVREDPPAVVAPPEHQPAWRVVADNLEALRTLAQERDWGRRVAELLVALKAEGQPITAADLGRRDVPDKDNAATYYQQLFQVKFAPNANAGPRLAGLSAEDGRTLDALRNAPTPEVAAMAAEIMAFPAVQQALALLKRGADCEHSAYPVNWAAEPPILFPHLAKFRAAARLLTARALVSARQGQGAEAMEWFTVGVRVSRHVTEEPTLIAQLVGQAMLTATLEGLRQTLEIAPGDAAARNQLEENLRSVDLSKGWTTGMSGERAMGIDFWKADPAPGPAWAVLSPEVRAVRDLMLAHYLQATAQVIREGSAPYRTAGANLEALDAQTRERPEYDTPDATVRVYIRTIQQRDETTARIGLARIALALKGYQEREQAYPDSLRSLQQSVDWTLPTDALTGGDYVYRREANGFIVYSVGRDLADNGGLSERDADGKLREGDTDIVWQCAQ